MSVTQNAGHIAHPVANAQSPLARDVHICAAAGSPLAHWQTTPGRARIVGTRTGRDAQAPVLRGASALGAAFDGGRAVATLRCCNRDETSIRLSSPTASVMSIGERSCSETLRHRCDGGGGTDSWIRRRGRSMHRCPKEVARFGERGREVCLTGRIAVTVLARFWSADAWRGSFRRTRRRPVLAARGGLRFLRSCLPHLRERRLSAVTKSYFLRRAITTTAPERDLGTTRRRRPLVTISFLLQEARLIEQSLLRGAQHYPNSGRATHR